jgi:inner membrane protein involved in colicin E2 resistance
MLRRIFAIAFIFLCTTAAWMFLGGTIMSRTYSEEPDLRDKVASSWGSPQVQTPPSVVYLDPVKREVTTSADGKDRKETETETVETPAPLESSRIDAGLNLEYRQKGLLWYSTYKVAFSGAYEIRNDTDHDREIRLRWAFPAQKAIYDDVTISIGKVSLPVVTTVIPAGTTATCHVAYRSHGLDSWTYNFGSDAQARNFSLQLTTNFHDVDFPENALSPTAKEQTRDGWRLSWRFTNLVSGYRIAVSAPPRLQPGPLAGEISYFAPVSLFFFFFVMLLVSTLKRIELHPMNYFFLAAAFFAFHLLLAYLVDHISIHAAFLIASVVSTGLVVSYLRLVTGTRFAYREAGIAQFVYLILFSYAFFFKGFTGLAITIGSIVTLFVAMQVTGRVRWSEYFGQDRMQAS